MSQLLSNSVIVGEPEVLEDTAAWLTLKAAVAELRSFQVQDGSIPTPKDHAKAQKLVATITEQLEAFAALLPHDAAYLAVSVQDFRRWATGGFGVPDFLDSLNAFQPQLNRVDGLRHLVVFPMYTQNGSTDRLVEAVLIEVRWPDFVADLEAGDYSNKLFVPIRFLDFTDGYDTNSAVLFPETVAMREIPTFTWGAIFADREAARFRRVVRAASEITKLDLPDSAARLLGDQQLAEDTFVMWDLIHDRTHMRGDLPFDPFMIKQRMPYFLYSLEELRCDLTAFREATRLFRDPETDTALREHAELVQYAIIFDRIFRFPLTGTRVRNYDGLGGQLLFAWLHQHHVLHWTDTQLTIDWDEVPDVVIALSDRINDLYWRSIDRPKMAHWLAAYDMVAETLTPNPASKWAVLDLPLEGPAKLLTDAVMDDEFPLSMFYEALSKKMVGVIESTAGITGSVHVIVVVTGASGDAGRAVCTALLAAGHTVIAVGSDELRLGEVDASWRYVCDLTDAAETRQMGSFIHEKEGGVDALVHLVGGWRSGHEDDDWNWLEPRILTTLRLTTLALVDELSASPNGRLVTIGSVAEANPTWGGANYAVLKSAAGAWVNAIASGWRKAGRAAAVELLVRSIGEDGTPVATLAAKVVDLMGSGATDLNGSRVDLSA